MPVVFNLSMQWQYAPRAHSLRKGVLITTVIINDIKVQLLSNKGYAYDPDSIPSLRTARATTPLHDLR